MAISLAIIGQFWTCSAVRAAQSELGSETIMEIVSAETEGAPVIYFPTTIHNFGSVSSDGKYSYKFVVRNTGDAPLELIKAKGS